MEFILTQRAIVWPAERLLETGDPASVASSSLLTVEVVVWLQLTGPSRAACRQDILPEGQKRGKSSF